MIELAVLGLNITLIVLEQRHKLSEGMQEVIDSKVETPLKLLWPRLRPTVYFNCFKLAIEQIIVPTIMLRFLRRFDKHISFVSIYPYLQEEDHLLDGRPEVELPNVAGQANPQPAQPVPVQFNREENGEFAKYGQYFYLGLFAYGFGSLIYFFDSTSSTSSLFLTIPIIIAVTLVTACCRKQMKTLFTYTIR